MGDLPTGFKCQTGLLVFQTYSDDYLAEAKRKTRDVSSLQSHDKPHLSLIEALREGSASLLDNVGILYQSEDTCHVIESFGMGEVVTTPIDVFVKRSDSNGLFFKALDGFDPVEQPSLARRFAENALTFKGIKTDCSVSTQNNRLTGTELIARAIQLTFLETLDEGSSLPYELMDLAHPMSWFHQSGIKMREFVQLILRRNQADCGSWSTLATMSLYCAPYLQDARFEPKNHQPEVDTSKTLYGCLINGSTAEEKWKNLTRLAPELIISPQKTQTEYQGSLFFARSAQGRHIILNRADTLEAQVIKKFEKVL